jgi:hypothetical protein
VSGLVEHRAHNLLSARPVSSGLNRQEDLLEATEGCIAEVSYLYM